MRSFQVQLSDSFKQFQSVIRNDIKELGIQVLSDRQFTRDSRRHNTGSEQKE